MISRSICCQNYSKTDCHITAGSFMPHLCYKAFLQPETQTEKLSRQILAWAGSHTTPFWCRQAMFKQVHHRPLKPLECWTVLVSTTTRQLRKFLDAWAGASLTGHIITSNNSSSKLDTERPKPENSSRQDWTSSLGTGPPWFKQEVLHSASSSGKP